MKRQLLLGLIGALGIELYAAAAAAYSGGITSLVFGSTGCPLCHTGGSVPTVVLSGPTTVAPGDSADYTLTIFTITAQNQGGLNVSALLGTLSTGGPFADGTTTLVGALGLAEITHTAPKPGDFLNTIEFSFRWTAPLAYTSVTLRGWGNAVDGRHSPDGDAASLATLEVFASAADTPTPSDTPAPTATPQPGTCPDAAPPAPALVTDPAAQACQAAIAKAGARYMKKDLQAVRHCLATLQAGTVAGDPVALCIGTATGAPTDPKAAAAILKAQAKAATLLRDRCPEAAIALLDACAQTESGLEICFLEQHRQRAVDAIAVEYGNVAPTFDKGERKCQKAIGEAAAGYLSAYLRAGQKCLVKRNKAGLTASGAALCIGALAGNTFTPPLDEKAAAAVAEAEGKLAEKIEQTCSDAEIAALDGCGNDLGSGLSCALCSHRTAVLGLLGDEFGGVQ